MANISSLIIVDVARGAYLIRLDINSVYIMLLTNPIHNTEISLTIQRIASNAMARILRTLSIPPGLRRWWHRICASTRFFVPVQATKALLTFHAVASACVCCDPLRLASTGVRTKNMYCHVDLVTSELVKPAPPQTDAGEVTSIDECIEEHATVKSSCKRRQQIYNQEHGKIMKAVSTSCGVMRHSLPPRGHWCGLRLPVPLMMRCRSPDPDYSSQSCARRHRWVERLDRK